MDKSSSLKTKFLALALRAARLPALRPLLGFLYTRLHSFAPVERLGENVHWTAIHHPQPDYPLHILILPKRKISSLPLAPVDDPDLYADLFSLVQQIIQDFDLDEKGYRLITNGGPNQSIPIWHWHLVSEAACQGSPNPGDPHA